MTAQHTPGPWALNPEPDALVYDPATQQGIAYTVSPGSPFIERSRTRQANARLIAAAPSLLAALRDAVSYMEHPAIQNNAIPAGKSLYNARAAIAKAEGR